MTSTTSTPTPTPRALVGFDAWLSRVENLFNGVAALGIFVLMLMATVQILGRKLFNMPVPGYIDIAEQSIALFAFLGAAYCQRLGGHVRMELLLGTFRGRLLWITEALGTLIALVLVTILIKSGFDHFYRAYSFGDSTIDISLPVWPSKLVVPIAFSLLWLRLLLQLVGYLRLLHTPSGQPFAVPLIENVAQQARREAREGLDVIDD